MPLILLAVMFSLDVVDFDDQLVFRHILPERLVRLLLNKLEEIGYFKLRIVLSTFKALTRTWTPRIFHLLFTVKFKT